MLRQHYSDSQVIVYENEVKGCVQERLISATRTASSVRVLGPGLGSNYLAVTYAGDDRGEASRTTQI